MEKNLKISYMPLKPFTIHQSIHMCILYCTKYQNKQSDHLFQDLMLFESIYKITQTDSLKYNKLLNYSILKQNHNLTQLIFDKV